MNTMLGRLAAKNLARRPRRTFLSMAAVGLAALTMTILLSMIHGLKLDLADNLQRYVTGAVLIEDRAMAKAGAHALTLAVGGLDELGPRLKAVAGVQTLAPRVTGAASVFVEGDAVFFPFLGMDFAADPMRLGDFVVPGGRLPAAGAREAVVSTGLADKLHLAVGDRLTMVTQTLRGSSNGMTFEVTGLVKPGLAQYQVPWLFADVETVRRLVKLGDGATSVLVTARPGSDPAALAASLQTVLTEAGRTTVTARAWDSASSTYALMDMAQIIYGFLSLLFAGLASTVIINTMLMVVLERQKEIGMLGALGMDPRQLRSLFLAEGALLAGGGALLGTLAGCALTLVLGVTGIDYTEALKGVSLEMSPVLRPVLDPGTPVLVFAASVAVALLFTLVPVAKLKNLPIVEALRGEA